MTGTVSLDNTKIEVLDSTSQIAIAVTRIGDLTSDASGNVLINGSTLFYPAADGYNGIKAGFSFNAGEGGTKTVVFPIVPTSVKLSYLDVNLVDLLRVTAGLNDSGNVAIYKFGILPSWIPSAPGSYQQVIKVDSSSGIRVEVVPISFGTQTPMVGASATVAGVSGIVPMPVAGDNANYLRGDATWQPVPPPAIASIDSVSSPGGNIDLIGLQGIGVTPDNLAKTISISLPIGTADNQALFWNNTTRVYAPQTIPLVPIYVGATLTIPGVSGLLSAAPAGASDRYAAADGTWRTEDTIPGQTGGTDGSVVRMTRTANTWQNAANTDSVDELYCLAFRQYGNYYKIGATITGLSGLTVGVVYYLDVSGGTLTSVIPTPSSTTRRVAVGKAIAPDTLIFKQGEVITG